MRIRLKTLLFALSVSTMFSSCVQKNVELNSMKCEYVRDGDLAVIYGKGLSNCKKLVFPGNKEAHILDCESNDSVLVVEVPHGTSSGKLLCYIDNDKYVTSDFMFRDKRGMILNFDDMHATWGGYDPMDEEGDPVRVVKAVNDSVLELPVTPPEQISGSYCLLYQYYDEAWTMLFPTFLQYVAKPEEGGRGRHSIAGDNVSTPNRDLCLKFEVNIPKECSYKKAPRVEIFFGPYDSNNKHGREISPIAHWAPYKTAGADGYYTDGWETVTIPLTEFFHRFDNDDLTFDKPLNLAEATNFTFCVMGDPGDSASKVYIAVDNFRIVPIK